MANARIIRAAGAAALFLSTVALPERALAVTDTNLAVIAVGAETFAYSGYLILGSATSGGCGGNLIYIDASTDTGKSLLAIAMTARATGQKISRIDYTVGSGNVCLASLIQL